MAITSKELAGIIGVSEATLSLVLNNKQGISKKTRDAVTEKIINLGYGYMFKNDKKKGDNKTTTVVEKKINRNIGLVLYKNDGLFMDTTPFYPLIIDGMDAKIRKNGYTLVVINISRNMPLDEKIGYIKESGCEGYVIYAPEMPKEDADAFLSIKIPFVILDNYFPDKNINAVTLNNGQGIYLLLNKLIEAGHRNIGYLGSGINIQSFGERKIYFEKFMSEYGLNIDKRFFVDIGYPEQNAAEGMRKLLEKHKELPTAFMTDNDVVAYGAIKALQKAGYSVPEDISVVGFSDRPLCTYIEPNITTVRIPRMRFGGEAVDILINKMINNEYAEYEKELSTVKTEVSVELIERDSVADKKER